MIATAAHPVPAVPFAQVGGRVQRRAWADPTESNPHHVILGPSGAGKDYLIRHGLLPLAWPVSRAVVVASKRGADKTWDGWGQECADPSELPAGLDRTDGGSSLPHFRVRCETHAEGERVLSQLLDTGSVIVVLSDALSLVGGPSRGGLQLGGPIARMLAEGRSNRLIVIACVNSTSYADSALRTQAGTAWVGAVANTAERKAYADLAGIPDYARPALDSMAPRRFMYADTHDGGGDLAALAITGV
jgi:hypothetical protein